MSVQSSFTSMLEKYGVPAKLKTSRYSSVWREQFDSISGKLTWVNVSTNEVVYTEPPPLTLNIKVIEKSYRKEEIDGTNVLVTDRKLILDGSLVVSTEDEIVIGQNTYQIVPPIRLRSFKGVPIVNEVQCRG